MVFRAKSSALGSAGNSFDPAGVHLRITSVPNTASFASFWHSVPAFSSPLRSLFAFSTSSTLSSVHLGISHDDNGVFKLACCKGGASGPGASEGLGAAMI